MQWSGCLGDVHCPRIWAGYDHLTAHCRLPFGDLAAEPPVPGEGRCRSPTGRRHHQRGLWRRVAVGGIVVPVMIITVHLVQPNYLLLPGYERALAAGWSPETSFERQHGIREQHLSEIR